MFTRRSSFVSIALSVFLASEWVRTLPADEVTMANIYAAWKSRGELVNRVVTECQGTFVAEEVSGKGNYVGSPYSRKLIWAGYNASPVYHRKSGAVRNERTGRLIKCDCEYAVNAGRYRSLSYTMDAEYELICDFLGKQRIK